MAGRGPIFGVDAATGEKKWEFLTVAGTDEAMKTWGGDSWRTGGGGGWMPGAYDVETNTVWWGTGNPAPLYDWAGSDWKTAGPRPGDNLYTTSVIGLDPDTGKLKFYHQELPHDAWDFDSAVGEFVMIERDGQKLVVHPTRAGYVFVYDRSGRQDRERLAARAEHQLRQGHRSQDRRADRPPRHGRGQAHQPVPGHRRRHQLELRVLQPQDRPLLQGRPGMVHGPRGREDDADPGAAGPAQHRRQLHVAPIRRAARPTVTCRARDPVTGAKKWEVKFPEPPLASLLSTGGNLVFVPDSRGLLHAYNAETGEELWSHNNGIGHNGGIISYSAKGKQYIAVATGWGSLVGDEFGALFGEPFKSMPKDLGASVVFALE